MQDEFFGGLYSHDGAAAVCVLSQRGYEFYCGSVNDDDIDNKMCPVQQLYENKQAFRVRDKRRLNGMAAQLGDDVVVIYRACHKFVRIALSKKLSFVC